MSVVAVFAGGAFDRVLAERRWQLAGRSCSRPIACRRTLFFISVGVSCSMKCSSNAPERADLRLRALPVLGREGVDGQKLDAELHARFGHGAHRCPRRASWPLIRGSPRSFAQRPLPSMMMAMWRGTRRWPASRMPDLGGARTRMCEVVLGSANYSHFQSALRGRSSGRGSGRRWRCAASRR